MFLLGGEIIIIKLLAMAAAAATVAVVVRVVLQRTELWRWFQSKRATLQQSDDNKLGFIIRKAMNDGKVSVVQGVLDETDQVVAQQRYVAEKLDDDLAATFNNNDIVTVRV